MTAKPIGGSNRLLTVEEVAELLAVSKDTVYGNWRRWGLVAYRVGPLLRFREREVWGWLDSQKAA